MRFRSDCKYSKAALNLESTHELLASILALKNKVGLQVDILVLGHVTDLVCWKISNSPKPFSKSKDTLGEKLIKQAENAKVPDLPNMKINEPTNEHDHTKMIISKRYHPSFGPFGQTFGASVRG